MNRHVLIIVTLDTKPEEAAYVRDVLRRRGLSTRIIDGGALGKPGIEADISREAVAKRAGCDLADLVSSGDKGLIMASMTRGVAGWASDLYERGAIHGMLGLGGGKVPPWPPPPCRFLLWLSQSNGHHPGVRKHAAFHRVQGHRGLSFRGRYVGHESITRDHTGKRRNALAAMVLHPPVPVAPARHTVGATAFGVTTLGLMKLRRLLSGPNLEMVFFHANGTGGAAMESLAREGYFDLLLDWTTHEILDREAGGIFAAKDDHLDILAEREIPCVVGTGAIDYACMGPFEKMPPHWRNRKVIVHNRNITLVRATAEEMMNAAGFLAGKLNRALAPVKVMIPLEGFSEPNAKGKQFYDPQADGAFRERLKALLNSSIEVIELPFHINDGAFVKRAAEEITALLPR